MNKKLMVVAIAAALAPVAAMADTGTVTIYGQMNVSVDSVKPGLNSSTANGNISGQRVTQINDNTSRLGFKGTEALGNGLSAVWQIESGINADGAAATESGQTAGTGSASAGKTLGTRNTFVGLTGGFGTAILGRHDTPYKLATRSLDVFADNIADNRSIMGQSGNGYTTFDGRQSNVIAYISPNFSGFTGAVAYVAGAENAMICNFATSATTGISTAGGLGTNCPTKGDAWSAMGTYANGPFFASLAYEKHNVGSGGTGTLGDPTGLGILQSSNEKAWKLGGGYNMGDFKVGLVYEKTSDDFGAPLNMAITGLTGLASNLSSDVFGHHAVYLSGAYTMGSNVIKAAYTKAGNLGAVSSSGAKQYSLGFDHNMSKRTTVYALYSKVSNDTNGVYGLTGGSNGGEVGGNALTSLGVGHAGVPTGTTLGQDPSVFSVGMKHSF